MAEEVAVAAELYLAGTRQKAAEYTIAAMLEAGERALQPAQALHPTTRPQKKPKPARSSARWPRLT